MIKCDIFILKASLGCVLFGYDHFGGDINAETVNDYRECQRKCVEKEYCKRWTFAPSMNQECYLKTNISQNLTHCHNCKTGFRSSSKTKCGTEGMIKSLRILDEINDIFVLNVI